MPTQPELLTRAEQLHEDLLAARDQARAAEHRLAVLLRQMEDGRLFRALGFSTVLAYARTALDLEPRQARDLLRIGRRLPDLPHLDAALASGRLGWTKARELVKVLTRDNEEAWIARATTRTSREIEKDVSVSHAGDPPPDGPTDQKTPARRRVTFEMEAADAETLRQALILLRIQCGAGKDELEEGVALAAMARAVIERSKEEQETAPSGEPYRVLLEHCPRCKTTTSPDAEVSDTIAAEAACDAEVIEMREGPDRGKLSRVIPPARRREVLSAAKWRCAVPHCQCRIWLDLHHLEPFAQGGTHQAKNLAPVCTIHHRLIHAGLLALYRREDGVLVVEHADGRRFEDGTQVAFPRKRRHGQVDASADGATDVRRALGSAATPGAAAAPAPVAPL